MSLIATWRAVLAELARPSDLPPGPLHAAYDRAVIGIGHAVVGAALAFPLAWADGTIGVAALIVARGALAWGYFLAKETGDLRRGGGLRDGIEDTVLVWFGTMYGPAWWPVALLGIAGYLMLAGAAKVRP